MTAPNPLPISNSTLDTDDFEIDLLIQTIHQCTGVNFNDYARSSLRRRVSTICIKNHCSHISELIPRILYNESFSQKIINELTVNVSELFRDPSLFSSLIDNVFPYLSSYANINIWIAGCACGEEAYSLAILLNENNLLRRCQIHATDINNDVLKMASSGHLKNSLDRESAERYRLAGGKTSLADYFTQSASATTLNSALLKHISFNQHDITSQPGFTSPQLILCRNVMIYFNLTLQNRVLNNLFTNLMPNGYLVIGPKESLNHSDVADKVNTIDSINRIYQTKRKNDAAS